MESNPNYLASVLSRVELVRLRDDAARDGNRELVAGLDKAISIQERYQAKKNRPTVELDSYGRIMGY